MVYGRPRRVRDDKRGEGHRLLRLPRQSLSSQLLHDIAPERNDATVPGWRNPWMRSNQRPFARGIIAGRVYYVSLYARPTENLQNAFLNKCEIVRVRRARSTGDFSAGNFADALSARSSVRPSISLAWKFATSAIVGRKRARRRARKRSLIFIYREDHLRNPEEFQGNCARVFLLAEILSGGSLCDLKSTVRSLCPRALQSVKLKWILCCLPYLGTKKQFSHPASGFPLRCSSASLTRESRVSSDELLKYYDTISITYAVRHDKGKPFFENFAYKP